MSELDFSADVKTDLMTYDQTKMNCFSQQKKRRMTFVYSFPRPVLLLKNLRAALFDISLTFLGASSTVLLVSSLDCGCLGTVDRCRSELSEPVATK